jgi:hypothetical protein
LKIKVFVGSTYLEIFNICRIMGGNRLKAHVGATNQPKSRKEILAKQHERDAIQADKKAADNEDRAPKVEPRLTGSALAEQKAEKKKKKCVENAERRTRAAVIAQQLLKQENASKLQIDTKQGKVAATFHEDKVDVIHIDKRWKIDVEPSLSMPDQMGQPPTYTITLGNRKIHLLPFAHTGKGYFIVTATADAPRVPITMCFFSTFGEVIAVQGSHMESNPSILEHFTMFCNQ